MAKGYTTRKLEVFSLHCRKDDKAVGNYLEFFKPLGDLQTKDLHVIDNESVIAASMLHFSDNKMPFVIYEG